MDKHTGTAPSHPNPLNDPHPAPIPHDVDSSFQSNPISIPAGVPYPSVVGTYNDTFGGATKGEQELGQGIITEQRTSALPAEGYPPQPKPEKVKREVADDEKQALGIPIGEKMPGASRSGSGSSANDDTPAHEKGSMRVPTVPTPIPVVDTKKGFSLFGKKKAKKTPEEEKAEELKKKNEVQPVPLFALYRYYKFPELVLNVIGLILAAAAGATQPLMTLIFGRLTTSFTNFTRTLYETGGDRSNPLLIEATNAVKRDSAHNATYLVYIGIGMLVCTYAYMLIWQWTGEINARRIKEKYLKAVLRQDIAYFDNLGAGAVTTTIQSDAYLVHTGIGEKVPTAVQYIATFITGFALAFAVQARLAGAMVSMLPCIMIAGGIMQKFLVKYSQGSLKHIGDGGSLAEEIFASIRTAQAFGAQKTLAALFDTHIFKAVEMGCKGARIHASGLSVMFFVIYAGYGLAFFFGGKLVVQGRAEAGEVITVFLSVLIGSFSMAMLAPELEAIGKARGGAAKLFATIERIPAIDSGSPDGLRPESCEGLIEFENVVFDYPSRPDVPVLKGISNVFARNATTALVGPSGSGKSSIVSLIERFYDPLSGVIKLDGRDIKTLNVKWLRAQIGLVSQEPTLFGMSIRKNIEAGLISTKWENAPPEQKFELVQAAAKKASAHDFIMTFPQGYDTDVGQGGGLLSGGQQARVAIARAIASDPPILLLDEATAALDTKSEVLVQQALDAASKGRTTITVAHRLSTIKHAESIVLVAAGEIKERGTHNELIDQAGLYAGLVEAQKLAEANTNDEAAEILADNESAEDSLSTEDLKRVKSNRSKAESKKEMPALDRRSTRQSLASEILAKRRMEEGENDEDEEPKNLSFPYLAKRCYAICRDLKWFYVAGFIASIASGAVYPALAIVFANGINTFALPVNQIQHESNRNALWYFITAILAAMIIWVQQFTLITTAENLTGRLRSLYLRAFIRQDIAYFDEEKNSTGALTAQLSENPQKIAGLAGVSLGAIIQSCGTIVIGMILGLSYGPLLALIGIACIPLLVSAGYIRLRVVVLKDQKVKKIHNKTAQQANEAASAVRTVASLTREDDCCRVYHEALEDPFQQSIKSAIRANLLYAVSQALSFWVIALVFYVGSRWLAEGKYNTQQFFVVLNSVVFASIQAGNVFSFVPDISRASGAGTAIFKLIDTIPEIDAESNEGTHLTRDIKGDLAFKGVHFRYPTRPTVRVLRGLDMDVPAGKFIALTGQSGCGKSTSIGMLERFYDPLAGQVTLDGVPLEDLNVSSFRNQIGLVSQMPNLYQGTIRFNIMLGANKPAEEVTEDEIVQACKDANIYDFIMSLPDGFETSVGNRGTSLSGGQKQRICIARALLRNPKILLLDEATSALDAQSERIVQHVLDQAARGRTTVSIAHRLNSIQGADMIYFFKEGRVAEAGTHQELIKLQGGYYELTQMQNLAKAT